MDRKGRSCFLIHFSVFFLLIAELVTKLDAVESTMVIPREGQTVSYLDNNIDYELAVIEKTEGDKNLTTAIPASMFNQNGDIVDFEKLPFIELKQLNFSKTLKCQLNLHQLQEQQLVSA